MQILRFLTFCVVTILLVTATAELTQDDFIAEMISLDHLPFVDNTGWREITTYSKDGNNGDSRGFYQKVGNHFAVIAEFDGPGVVTRFRCGRAYEKLRIIVDNDTIFDDMSNEFFQNNTSPFIAPMVQRNKRDSYFCFIPIPFRTKIRFENYGDSLGKYWQTTARLYPAGTDIRGYHGEDEQSTRELLARVKSAWENVADFNPDAGKQLTTVNFSESIAPGTTKTIADITDKGIITSFNLKVKSTDQLIWRNAILKIFWDGNSEPAVSVPLGHFFGSGTGGLAYNSFFMGMTVDSTFFCRFRMPFFSRALIQLENTGSAQIEQCASTVRYEKKNSLPGNTAHFHAFFREEVTNNSGELVNLTGLNNYHILSTTGGKGRFVGMHFAIRPRYMETKPEWWGEGDPMMWIDTCDTSWPPSFHGTGTEEYFNGGWCGFNRLPISTFVPTRPNDGDTIDGRGRKLYLVNSWHNTDYAVFDNSLTFSIEHGSTMQETNEREDSIASVAWFYQQNAKIVNEYPGNCPSQTAVNPIRVQGPSETGLIKIKNKTLCINPPGLMPYKVSIFGCNGRKAMKTFSSAGNKPLHIPMNTLSRGILLIRIDSINAGTETGVIINR